MQTLAQFLTTSVSGPTCFRLILYPTPQGLSPGRHNPRPKCKTKIGVEGSQNCSLPCRTGNPTLPILYGGYLRMYMYRDVRVQGWV